MTALKCTFRFCYLKNYIRAVGAQRAPQLSAGARRRGPELLVLYKVKLRDKVSPKGSQAQYGARRKCAVCINTVTITL